MFGCSSFPMSLADRSFDSDGNCACVVVCLPSPDTINLISNQMWLFYNVMVGMTRSKVFFLVPGPLYNPLMPWSVRPRHLVLYCVVLCSSWCPGPPFFCCCFLSQIVFCFVLLFVLYFVCFFVLRFFVSFVFCVIVFMLLKFSWVLVC